MRDGPSLTAEIVTWVRAIQGIDPFAWSCLRPWMRATGRAYQRAARWGVPINALSLGWLNGIAERHCLIDATLLEAVKNGAQQVVFLGAGYDARPWRFADQLSGTQLFIVDHPATAARRAKCLPTLPDAIRIDIDFDQADFGDALLTHGFESQLSTFIIWEGVSMYLDPATVEGVIHRLTKLVTPGSAIALDLWMPRTKRQIQWFTERVGAQLIAWIGEPFKSWWSTDTANVLFAQRGFTVTQTAQAGRTTLTVFVATRD